MEKKRKWEREYERYSTSTELDERLEYLQDLINGKVATKEEYDEHKKLTAIKANLPKVKNILELRGKLEEQRAELKAEITRREFIAKIDKTILTLEDEMVRLETAQTVLQEKLKDANLSEEEKAKIEQEIRENENKKQENNVKFGKCHEGKDAENKKAEKSKLKDVNLEDLKNKAVSISSNISQCNLACNKLMQGFSWQSIEVALDKYEGERLKAKGKEAAKMKQNREAAKVSNAKGQQAKAGSKSQDEQEENALANLTIWQKIKNWAKTTWGKVKEQFVEDEDKEQEQSEEAVKTETAEEAEEKPTFWQKVKNWFKQDESNEKTEEGKGSTDKGNVEKSTGKEESFRQYLREVAEKGIDGVEQEKTEARMKSAREKLEANRAAALKREAERNNLNNNAR